MFFASLVAPAAQQAVDDADDAALHEQRGQHHQQAQDCQADAGQRVREFATQEVLERDDQRRAEQRAGDRADATDRPLRRYMTRLA